MTSTCLFEGTHRSAAELNSLPDAEQKLALGLTSSELSPTQHPQLSPPRRRRCAQVRERCMSVATISHAPQLFLRARVDQHPTHHPSPAPTVLFSKAKCQGPRARPDDPRPHAHVRRAAHRGARARRARRFDLRRRRRALALPEHRRSTYVFENSPLGHVARDPVRSHPDSRRSDSRPRTQAVLGSRSPRSGDRGVREWA